MIIALSVIIAAVICVPIVAMVLLASLASHREESALSLGQPAQGIVQAAGRRLLDFHSEEPAWPLPRSCTKPVAAPALRPVAVNSIGQPRRSTVTDTPRSVVTSKVSVRTAA